jgi:hypothetical protein
MSVFKDIDDPKIGQAVLSHAHQFPRAPDGQIALSYLDPILVFYQGLDPVAGFIGLGIADQDAVARSLAAPHPAAQLVQL